MHLLANAPIEGTGLRKSTVSHSRTFGPPDLGYIHNRRCATGQDNRTNETKMRRRGGASTKSNAPF